MRKGTGVGKRCPKCCVAKKRIVHCRRVVHVATLPTIKPTLLSDHARAPGGKLICGTSRADPRRGTTQEGCGR
eukprot:13647307-Alexandrium_andersonii.AAC.1